MSRVMVRVDIEMDTDLCFRDPHVLEDIERVVLGYGSVTYPEITSAAFLEVNASLVGGNGQT